MSDVLKLGKKVLTVGITFTTILWSVVGSAFLALLPATAATCPAFAPGDMLKVKGKPAIYAVNATNQVLYFPSGDEYKSWNVNDKYGNYTTVTQECYDSLQVPQVAPMGINYRPGSYIVKRPSSDQLYVVEPGNMLAKITVDAAKALYGSSYKVMTVADVFWPNYGNSRGADVTEAKVHPGMLVKNGGKTWYMDKESKLREVTDTGFIANRFKLAFVHVATDAMISGLAFGDKIDAEVAGISDRTQSGVTPGATPPAATPGSLTVSLASDNPFAATVISDGTSSSSNGAQASIPVLKLNFTAGSDGEVKVTGLKLKRGGVSADTDLGNMYLYDGATQLASNPSVANNMVNFSKSAGLFTVSKGTTKTITVKMDLKNAVAAGKTLSFSVDSAASITAASGTVGGTFPVAGNIFTVANVTDLGKLAFTNVSPASAGTVDPGTNGFEVWRFSAASTNQDMELRKISFTIVGSVSVGDLKNFGLWDGATQIGTTVADMGSDKMVTFDLATPYLVTKGQTKNLSLKADVVAGTNRTFYASIQNSSDLIVFDKNYGVLVKPTAGTNSQDSWTVVQAGGTTSVNWTVNTGSLTQTTPSDAPNGNIADGATNLTLAKFTWKANGEDIKVSSLNVSSTMSVTTDKLANVRLLVNGSQVGTTISTLTGNGASNTGWGTFGNSFIVKAGTTATVTVVADTTDSTVGASDTIIVGLVVGSSNAQGTVSLTGISTVAQTGNTLTVRAGTVSVAKNAAFGDKTSGNPTGTVNATQVKVSSLVITAGAGEDVDVTQIVLEDLNVAAANCIGTTLQNLTLKDSAGKQIGNTIPNPASTCATRNTYTFNLTPAVKIANGAQYVVDVFADLKASFTTAATALIDVNKITASGRTTGSDASVTPTAQSVPLQYVYVAASGALMVQNDPDAPVANNYLMGTTDQTIAKYRITASSTEAVNITQLVVSAIFSTGATGTMSNIRLIDDATGAQVGSAVPAFSDSVAGTSSPTTTYSHATFSGLNLTIPKGIAKTFTLKVDFTTYEGGGFSTTGQTIAPVLLQSYYTAGSTNPVTATGASSGTSLTATISTAGTINAFPGALGAYSATTTLYRAKLTIAWAGDAPSGASSPSTAQTVAKFVITNQANAGSYPATVNLVNLNFSTTISNAAGSSAPLLTVYKDSLSSAAIATTYFSTTGTSSGTPIAISGNTRITAANFNSNNGVEISSGASKTFYVTLDTSGAASTKSLSVQIPASAANTLTWTDGVTASLTAMGTDLPLQFKTFTY